MEAQNSGNIPPQEAGSGAQVPENEEDQIQYVVEQVNHLLGRNFSLVEFDELPAIQLLQTLSDVVGELSLKDRVEFDKVPLEQGCQQLVFFINRTLGYKVPPMIQHSFFVDFQAGEKTIINPVFYWVLKNLALCRKRVYLGKYLSRIDVPEDLKMQDPGIQELCQRLELLKTDFKEVHKRVDQLREASADPTEARRRIQQLEGERDQLHASIEIAQRKLSGVSNRDALVASCKSLRAVQEEGAKLTQKRDEQQRAVEEAQRKARDSQMRLRDVRRDIGDNRMDAVVQRMTDDLHANRMLLEQKLPGELNERRVKVAALTKLSNESVDIAELQTELTQLERECSVLSAEVAKRNQPMDDGTNIVAMKQQVARVVGKKKEAMTELQSLQDRHNSMLEMQRERQEQLDRLRSSKILKGEDFKRYSNQVRSKTAAANNMKRRLADLRAELGVLQYTEKVLKDTHEELQGDLSELEERLGAKGYVARAEQLSKVGEEKAQVEQVKAQTLEELSAVVQSINKEIHAHRDALAPRIVELRNQRNAAQTLEQEWEEKRSAYEYQQGMLMQEVNKLESDVANLTEELRMNESVYHRFNTQLQLLKVQAKRVEEETEFRDGKRQLDSAARTYVAMFNASTENLETATKNMQRRRRDIEENHESRLQQVEYFTALRKLLEAKAHSLSNEQPTAVPGQGFTEADLKDMMNTTAGGVNRLVLGSD